MRIEVLISTMHQRSIDIYKKFNLETDCLIINQTDSNHYEEVMDGDKKIRMISTPTRGSGTSRNLGLLNSNADIIVIADDDEVLEDGYKENILEEFSKNPSVDFFIFRTMIYQDDKVITKVKEEKDLALSNSLRYGSVHFVFKREEVVKHNISFSTFFGAGTENGSGEDSLFIRDSFKAGLKLRTSMKLLAKVYNDGSTWFKGYDEKFFYDKGMLARALFPKIYRIYIEQFIQRHKEFYVEIDKSKAKELMVKGAKDFGGKQWKRNQYYQ